jgi:hypothetical protein
LIKIYKINFILKSIYAAAGYKDIEQAKSFLVNIRDKERFIYEKNKSAFAITTKRRTVLPPKEFVDPCHRITYAPGTQYNNNVLLGKPYEKTRKHSKFDFGEDLQVIPVEIEIDSLLHSLIENQILENTGVDKISFEEWVNICFKERMEQILTDPREFGKIILNPIRTLYCLPQVDISNTRNQQK